MNEPIRENHRLVAHFRNVQDLEDEIRKTPIGMIVEVEFCPRSDKQQPVPRIGYYNGITDAYWGNGKGANKHYSVVELLLPGEKKVRHIAIEAICTFTRYDPKTAYVLEQKPDVPPRRKGRINLKSEFM